MKYNKYIVPLMLLVFGLLIATNGALAGQAEIKARMKARLPEIDALKVEGVIGENNQGFLEFRSDQKKSAELVKAENKDRQIVYQAIAKKIGTTVDKVGARRALQIRESAEPGTWIQTPDGKWTKK